MVRQAPLPLALRFRPPYDEHVVANDSPFAADYTSSLFSRGRSSSGAIGPPSTTAAFSSIFRRNLAVQSIPGDEKGGSCRAQSGQTSHWLIKLLVDLDSLRNLESGGGNLAIFWARSTFRPPCTAAGGGISVTGRRHSGEALRGRILFSSR
ncbi:hypothetical protein JCGZ_10787 [Jatropha curcas]|uniref:Uncharacterized protein n=1 Tax=Jatropha curcas TaxID=180498 RepID=A0A067LQ47_JATCU|nr:hypothetical protein JCGZ_10787 [Jatropha curcas]